MDTYSETVEEGADDITSMDYERLIYESFLLKKYAEETGIDFKILN